MSIILKSILRSYGYQLNTRPYELNIVGVRSNSVEANQFDDKIYVFYKTDNINWETHEYPATTDPGTFWLQNPMNEQGTAILAEGQYVNAYQIGLHRGIYKALVQTGAPVTIIRDYDRNAVLDFYNGNYITGYFGINIHRADKDGSTFSVSKYSAGCQVFQNADQFEEFLKMCDYHRELYGNYFTYTLIDQRAKWRAWLRYISVGVVSLIVVAISVLAYKLFKK